MEVEEEEISLLIGERKMTKMIGLGEEEVLEWHYT